MTKRTMVWLVGGMVVLGCTDNSRLRDAGGDSEGATSGGTDGSDGASEGGTGGASGGAVGTSGGGSPSDAGGSGGVAAATGGAGGLGGATEEAGPVGGTASAAGTGAAGGGGSPAPTCANNGVPDAGEDECMACLIERCCAGNDFSSGPYGCFGRPRCYEELFGAVRACFADAIASGSTEEPWHIVASCDNELAAPDIDAGVVPGPPDGGGFVWLPTAELVGCVVGRSPPGSDAAMPDDDAGTDSPFAYPHANCAEECFGGWR